MAEKYDYVVAQDGTGDFRTIQEAVDTAMKLGDLPRILVKPGVYREKVNVPPGGIEVYG